MDRFRGYKEEDIEIDKKDVQNRLDMAIELKAKVTGQKAQEYQKIIDQSREQIKILDSYNLKFHKEKKGHDLKTDKTVSELWAKDLRYKELKQQTTEWMRKEQIRNNKKQIEKAREITEKAQDRGR